MLTVSLHGIKLHAPHGLYPQEHVLGNNFEVDVDVYAPTHPNEEWPYIDYTVLHQIVNEIFLTQGELLETFTKAIHTAIKARFPEAEKVRVAVKKLHPPMQGTVHYSRVQYED